MIGDVIDNFRNTTPVVNQDFVRKSQIETSTCHIVGSTPKYPSLKCPKSQYPRPKDPKYKILKAKKPKIEPTMPIK